MSPDPSLPRHPSTADIRINSGLRALRRSLKWTLRSLQVKNWSTSPLRWFWKSIPSYLPFYVLACLVGFAAWKGRQETTVIAEFHLPPQNATVPLPFSGETVAHVLLDAVSSIRSEARADPTPSPCGILATGNPSGHFARTTKRSSLFPGDTPPGTSFQIRGRVAVEVKGISVEALISVAREILERERTVTGDVVLDGADKFRLMARAEGLGPWTVGPFSLSFDGLRAACCALAEGIMEGTDKNVLAGAFFHRGQPERVVEIYREMPRDKGDLPIAHINLGTALLETGNLEEATWHFREAILLDPRSPAGFYGLGAALDRGHKYDNAIAEYKRALALNSEHTFASLRLAQLPDAETPAGARPGPDSRTRPSKSKLQA